MPASILVVDDESSVTEGLDLLLRDHGYEVNAASTAAEAETLLARRWFDLVFLLFRIGWVRRVELDQELTLISFLKTEREAASV